MKTILIALLVLVLPSIGMAGALFPDQPVEMKPGYGAQGAGAHYGVPMGLPGNDCVINPVSMTRGLALTTITMLVPGDVIEIPATILFDFDKDVVLPEGESLLAETVYAKLMEFGVTEIEVIGHTDAKGTEEYNYALGLRRASAVANVLSYLGFPSEDIVTGTGGEDYPIAQNEWPDGRDDPEGRQRNRRVEITIMRVADKEVQQEELQLVDRNPQIFHRLTSNNTVLCESSYGHGVFGNGYYYGRRIFGYR
jgi:outer membrane protein OmpA-like peptidoglycan-associated protein